MEQPFQPAQLTINSHTMDLPTKHEEIRPKALPTFAKSIFFLTNSWDMEACPYPVDAVDCM
jgi:hypothetical protein